jgi:Rickettsia 17 kDa surface antigen.
MVSRRFAFVFGLLAACLSSGCESMSNTAKGGLIGGGLGAGFGAAAGGGKGALIGGLAGTAIGGLVGNDIDQQEKRHQETRLAVAEARAAAQVGPPMGMSDVIQMAQQGTHEDIIINQIRATQSVFLLSNEDIRTLQANRVPTRVIIEMQIVGPARA